MGGNIPGGNFLGGDFPEENFPRIVIKYWKIYDATIYWNRLISLILFK